MSQEKLVMIFFTLLPVLIRIDIDRMRKVRDDKLETPANFSDLLNQWSLESITCITLDRRLGLMKESNKDPNAVKLIKVILWIIII